MRAFSRVLPCGTFHGKYLYELRFLSLGSMSNVFDGIKTTLPWIYSPVLKCTRNVMLTQHVREEIKFLSFQAEHKRILKKLS
jgi:hypothetical protein